MWLMAAANMDEKNRKLLKQPYLRRAGTQRTKTNDEPYRTKEETIDFIFEGL